MKIKFIIITLTFLYFNGFSQNIHTSRKGSKFFPGHFDIFVTVDNKSVRYELFNHWYSWAYTEYRQLTIPLDSLDLFNQNNDTINIKIHKGKVKLVDKKYLLSRRIRHRNLCTSVQTMRKISFACKLSSEYKDIRHFQLYDREDLKLSEEEFKRKVIEKLNEKIK
jgi:hypothetical protein